MVIRGRILLTRVPVRGKDACKGDVSVCGPMSGLTDWVLSARQFFAIEAFDELGIWRIAMKMSKLSIGLACAALVAAPAIAQVSMNPAVAPLSGDEAELAEGSGIIIGVIAAAAVIGAIVIASDEDERELPISG